jgi:hypothetical protein
MGFQPHDFEREWQGLEPEQTPPPETKGGGRWLVGLILLVIGACVIGALLIVQRFRERTAAAEPPVIVPTSPVQEEEVTTEATDFNLAPTVTTVSNEEIEQPPIGAGNVDAIRVERSIQIDGSLADWPEEETVTSAFRVYSAEGWDGTADLTAVWHLVWDPDNLYFGIEITDDIHVQTQTGNQIFRGDSVDIQFDTDRAADYAPRLSPDDFQVTLSPGNFGNLSPSAFLFRGTADNQILDAPGQHSIVVAAQRVDGGYVLEAAVPWRNLEKVPERDLIIGIALNANDNDTAGTAVQEVMMSHVATRTLRDPTGWGTLTLK